MDGRRLKYSEKTLFQCYIVHDRVHMDWPETEKITSAAINLLKYGFAHSPTLAKLRKAVISCVMSVCLSTCPSFLPSPWDNWAPIGRIFMRFDISVYFEKLLGQFHIQRMDQARPTRKLLDWKPMGIRRLGRPRQRWQEDVMEELKKLKVKNSKEIAKDRKNLERLG